METPANLRHLGDLAALRRRRFLLTAAVLSVLLHLAAALLIVFLPRLLPFDARPQEVGTVELLMVEQKGTTPSASGEPRQDPPAPLKQEVPPEATQQEAQQQTPPAAAPEDQPSLPTAPTVEEAGLPPPAKAATSPKRDEKPPTPQPAPPPPKAQEAPVFDLAGTESEFNATVLGGGVLPASPDNRFRNRPPLYPQEAEMRGEHGAVVVVIHVSEAGLAAGVDVVESSGITSLDQAAVVAVRKWRFHPALREGRAVPFDMPFRFIFEPY